MDSGGRADISVHPIHPFHAHDPGSARGRRKLPFPADINVGGLPPTGKHFDFHEVVDWISRSIKIPLSLRKQNPLK